MPCPRSLMFILALLFAASPPNARSEVAEDPWRLMSGLRFSEAGAAFDARDDATELDRLGRALSLLGAQPKTEANLTRAERLLGDLAAESSDPDVAARAAYLHARIPHIHRLPSDWVEASRRYLAAYHAHPAHPLGQRAFVRHGIVTLFRPLPPGELADTLANFIAASTAIDDPAALRDLEWLLLAVHERRLQEPSATLRHLERLLANPTPMRELTRISFLVQAGELARELGDRAKAARYYREFLDVARRDSRVYFIRQRLAEVEASS